MKVLYKILLGALNSKLSIAFLMLFCGASFYLGQQARDMNLFAASGAIMTIFGLFSIITFTTIDKYLNQDKIVGAKTGLTGPPVASAEQAAQIRRETQDRARTRIQQELRAEVKGIALTVVGTLVWAYGSYVPIFKFPLK